MIDTQHWNGFNTALTLAAHAQAKSIAQQQQSPQRARQVYLNTLAVCGASAYLDYMGYDADRPASSSWNPLLHVLLDTADLAIRGCGTIECRPVLPGERVVRVPPETPSDRLGVVAVGLDESLQRATLLGFAPDTTRATIALDELQPLEELLECLQNARHEANAPSLLQLVRDLIEAGWQQIDDFAETLVRVDRPAFSMRAATVPTPEEPTIRPMGCSKDVAVGDATVVLAIGMAPLAETEVDVWVQVRPSGTATGLPQTLQLQVLDSAGSEVMQAQARGTEALQLKFGGETGEEFGVRLVLGGANWTERFTI